jgi:hypothetical protein
VVKGGGGMRSGEGKEVEMRSGEGKEVEMRSGEGKEGDDGRYLPPWNLKYALWDTSSLPRSSSSSAYRWRGRG